MHQLQNLRLPGHVVKVDVDGREFRVAYPPVNVDVLDCHADHGCSGGPVIDNRGHIRGVYTLVIGTRLAGAVPVEELDL